MADHYTELSVILPVPNIPPPEEYDGWDKVEAWVWKMLAEQVGKRYPPDDEDNPLEGLGLEYLDGKGAWLHGDNIVGATALISHYLDDMDIEECVCS